MEFRILGPLEVEAEAGPVVLPRGRGRSLLGLLVLRAGEVVSTARLVDELWGEVPPPTALTALHGLVAALRRRLEPDRLPGQPAAMLLTRPPGYVLAIDRGQVDANQFRDLVDAAAGAPPRPRAALLRRALALWRGPALADFAYEPFAQTAITALSELRLTAVEERIEADLAVGRHTAVVAELEELIAEHPLRERLRAQLMRALYRFGRQADALDAYADARHTLATELGIDPGPVLRDLRQAIMRQDPALDPQVSASSAESVAEPAGEVAVAGMHAWLTHGRKTVTVVFVDLAAAGAAVRSDPEALREVVGRGVDIAVEVLGRHGGTVEGVIADVVVAIFGVPMAHENDAARAVRAAADVRTALAALNAEGDVRVAARIGINTGEVVVGDPGVLQGAASGGTVNVAARLQQAASDGEVLLGEATRRLVGDIVVVEPVDDPGSGAGGWAGGSWRLVEVRADAPARTPPLDSPLVGREVELAWLQTSFARMAEAGRPELAAVIGEAGVGKSRLALEFAEALGGRARIVYGHCPAYGESITYWPLREIVADAADSRAASHLLDRLEDEEAAGAELFPAVRRFVEAAAAEQPLVVVLDDVHWAQPTFLDLLEYLAQSAHGPVLLLCLARPELLERNPGWARRQGRTALLRLEPLGPEDSRRLVTERLVGRVLPPETISHVIETAQGNPLFVEQLIAALRDELALTLPPSVEALLAARLDRLGPAERDLLRCASVVGVTFSVRALTALVPDQARPFLGRHLRSLEHKELVRRSRRPFLGAPARSFRHVLIQHAAYRSMTHRTRAELHARFAGWLETEAPTSPVDSDELIGFHFEQAHRHRRDLGLADQRTSDLAERAGERLTVAGLRAYRRLDIAGAQNLLARARSLLPADHPQRRAVMVHLAEGYPVLGRHAEADAVLTELLEEVTAAEDRRLEQKLRLERARVRLFLGPDPVSLDAIRQEAEQARATFEADGDHAGVATALFVLGLVRRREGAISAFETIARQGLAAAQRAGHAREEAGARWNVAWAVQAGTTPVREAIQMCTDLLPLEDTVHPGVLCELASLHAMLGEYDEARDLIARTRRLMVERWRQRGPLMYPAAAAGRAAILAGDPAAAERELRAALDLGLEMGIREHISQLAATLAAVLARLGQLDEAERFAAVSAARAPADSVASQAGWRAATGLIRSRRGEHREAGRLARAAVDLAPRDMLNLRAELHADLAVVLRAAGQHEAALLVISEATTLYGRKGNVAGVARTRALQAAIAGTTNSLPH